MSKMAVTPLLVLLLVVAAVTLTSAKSCWEYVPGVKFPNSYVIMGDANSPNALKHQLLQYYDETNITATSFPGAVAVDSKTIFDSADAGGNEFCYSTSRQSGFRTETSFEIKCRHRETVVQWQSPGRHNVKGSIFVEPTGENVYWRSPKSPGEVHVTSIEKKESMVIFAGTASWTDSTPFLIDHRRRLIFWVASGQTSISYTNLLASSGPIATVPSNADATNFNSMTLDFESGSIYWLVTSAVTHSVYRYNYISPSPVTELVANFEASGSTERSHLQYLNSTLYSLARTERGYQLESFSLWNSTSFETVLTCSDEQHPKYIHDFSIFKSDPDGESTSSSCKNLNCTDICLDGPKPQCICPYASTTLTGPESNTCSEIDIQLTTEAESVGENGTETLTAERRWISGVMDTRTGAVFWQDANAVKALFLNDTSASAKTIFTTDGPVAIELDEAHRTLILISTTGSATIIRYDDPQQFQTRNVHPNDGVERTNFKYHCQRLYWIEHISRYGNDVLQSFYFINGQTGTVKNIPKGTHDYVIKTGRGVDCGPIEIHATALEPPAREPAETVFNSTSSVGGLEAGGHSSVTTTKSQAAEDMSPLLLYHVQQLCEIYVNTSRTN